MWPSDLFCQLLMVSIITLSVSTICSISCAQSTVLLSYASKSIFQMPQVVEYLLFAESMFHFHTMQHTKQMLSPYVSSSEGWGILAWGHFSCWKPFFPQSNSPSYFMTTSTVFGHQTSEVTKLFHSFQILSTDCVLYSSSQWRRQGGASRGTGPGCKTLCPGCAPAVELSLQWRWP